MQMVRKLNTPSEYSRGRNAWKPFFGPACDTILYDLSIVEGRGYKQGANKRGEGQESV
jgi:hypothetical protein